MLASLPLILLFLAIVSSTSLSNRTYFSSSSSFPDPTVDPFYKIPANVSKYSNGQVIQARHVNTTITASVKESFQLFYRTTNTQDEATATVATIWKPSKPRSPPVVMSYQVYEDSDALDCDPSWAFVSGSDSKATSTTLSDTAIYVQWALDHGIYVVVPDDEGARAAFIAGFDEGKATLDGMRATRSFFKFKSNVGFAIVGYSGGAHATAWASNLASSYASDLHIIGAVHGGTPTDVNATLINLNKSPFAGFIPAGLQGLSSAYPRFGKYIYTHLNKTGLDYLKQVRQNNFCNANVTLGAPLVDFLSFFTVSRPLSQPIIKKIMAKESLLMNISSVGVAVPKYPRYLWHGVKDEIVPFTLEQQYVDQQCAKGANIQFQTFLAAEHIQAEYIGIPEAIVFLSQVFDRSTPKIKCGSAVSKPATLSDPKTQVILGTNIVQSLMNLNNTQILGKTIVFQ